MTDKAINPLRRRMIEDKERVKAGSCATGAPPATPVRRSASLVI